MGRLELMGRLGQSSEHNELSSELSAGSGMGKGTPPAIGRQSLPTDKARDLRGWQLLPTELIRWVEQDFDPRTICGVPLC